jgi:hypothetical protein
VNETKRGWFAGASVLWYGGEFWGVWAGWDDARSNVFEEDGDIWIGHDPPTNGLADAYNVQPYRYASVNPDDGLGRYPTLAVKNWEGDTWDHSWAKRTWSWLDGRQVPCKVQNEMAGYRDLAVVEVA